MDMRTLRSVSKWLVLVGAVNWGLVGLFDYNLVEELLGSMPMLVQVVYVLVGVSGLWWLLTKLGVVSPLKK
jgi:uncharacterized protein